MNKLHLLLTFATNLAAIKWIMRTTGTELMNYDTEEMDLKWQVKVQQSIWSSGLDDPIIEEYDIDSDDEMCMISTIELYKNKGIVNSGCSSDTMTCMKKDYLDEFQDFNGALCCFWRSSCISLQRDTNHKDFSSLFFCLFHVISTRRLKAWVDAMQEELLQFEIQKVWVLVDLPHGKKAIGSWQEEGIDYV
ncbi:hypothetical protein Tco_1048779 [Tanacetum coccineum]